MDNNLIDILSISPLQLLCANVSVNLLLSNYKISMAIDIFLRCLYFSSIKFSISLSLSILYIKLSHKCSIALPKYPNIVFIVGSKLFQFDSGNTINFLFL